MKTLMRTPIRNNEDVSCKCVLVCAHGASNYFYQRDQIDINCDSIRLEQFLQGCRLGYYSKIHINTTVVLKPNFMSSLLLYAAFIF